MQLIFFFAFVIFTGGTLPVDHEFHFSRCEIDYSKEDDALQISLRIFIDDLEEAILKEKKIGDLKLCTKKESDNAEEVLLEYLKSKFIINIDGTLGELNFIGKETSDDLMAVWCYFEVPNASPKNEILIENNVLMELFDDQKNMVVLKVESSKEHFLFQKGDSSAAYSIK